MQRHLTDAGHEPPWHDATADRSLWNSLSWPESHASGRTGYNIEQHQAAFCSATRTHALAHAFTGHDTHRSLNTLRELHGSRAREKQQKRGTNSGENWSAQHGAPSRIDRYFASANRPMYLAVSIRRVSAAARASPGRSSKRAPERSESERLKKRSAARRTHAQLLRGQS